MIDGVIHVHEFLRQRAFLFRGELAAVGGGLRSRDLVELDEVFDLGVMLSPGDVAVRQFFAQQSA